MRRFDSHVFLLFRSWIIALEGASGSESERDSNDESDESGGSPLFVPVPTLKSKKAERDAKKGKTKEQKGKSQTTEIPQDTRANRASRGAKNR